ncbi:MAG: DNA methyltransferase, partial [Rubrobacteraceae bacterium]
MRLNEIETYGEPGAVVYLSDCVALMRLMPPESVDAVFADPPYRLSGGGVTVRSGEVVSVDKGKWDRSLGSFERDHEFNVLWLEAARRILKSDGSLWVSGTHHIIFSLGFALQSLGFRIINSIAWEKPDPTPNALRT